MKTLSEQFASHMRRFFELWSRVLPMPGFLISACMFVAAGSGILLAFAYDINRPFDSLQVLILSNPAGTFLRGIHYWSAQFFFVLVVIHLIDQLSKDGERELSAGQWARLSTMVPVTLFLMISGYLLKGDRSAILARQVIEGLLGTLPMGDTFRFLVLGSGEGLQFVYSHHISTATLIVFMLILEHSRGRWPEWLSFIWILGISMLISALKMPGLSHEGAGTLIKGPWFFLGLQQLLHWISEPLWLVVGGAICFGMLCSIPLIPAPSPKYVKVALAVCLVLYMGLCLTTYAFRGPDWEWALPWKSR